MKNLLFYSICTLFLISCSRNINHFNTSSEQHLKYYRYTNKGLLSILDGQFKKSSVYYKKAFKIEEGFAMDYYNALRVADTIEDHELAYLCAKRLAKIGESLEFLETIPILKSDQNIWNEIVLIKNNSLKNRDEVVYQKVLEMAELDQKVREYYHESLPPEEAKIKEKIKNKTDSLNFIEFRKILNEFGFPSMKKLVLGRRLPPYHILLLHFSLHKYDGIIELLNTAFNNFEISNLEYSYYFDKIKGGVEFRKEPVVKIGNNYYYYLLNKEQLKAVNSHRKKIGLISYEENVRLIIDKLKKTTKLKFNYDFNFDILPSEFITKEKIDRNFILINGL